MGRRAAQGPGPRRWARRHGPVPTGRTSAGAHPPKWTRARAWGARRLATAETRITAVGSHRPEGDASEEGGAEKGPAAGESDLSASLNVDPTLDGAVWERADARGSRPEPGRRREGGRVRVSVAGGAPPRWPDSDARRLAGGGKAKKGKRPKNKKPKEKGQKRKGRGMSSFGNCSTDLVLA